MNFLQKSKLFQREKMKPLKPKDYLKVVVIIGIIIVPLLFGFLV